LLLFGSLRSSSNCATDDIYSEGEGAEEKGNEGTNFVVFGTMNRNYSEISLSSPSTENEQQLSQYYYQSSENTALHFEDCARSVSLAGDFNNDRYEDLLIGDPLHSRVYLFFGSSNGFTNLTKGFLLTGGREGEGSGSALDYFGWAVSNAGDFNHDGYDDIIISALLNRTCFIIYGRRGHFENGLSMSDLTLQEGISIKGSSSSVQTGIAVSSAGDFNGDGVDDVAVSAMGRDNGNVVYILYGFSQKKNNHKNIVLDDLNSWKGVKVVGPSFSYIGYSISWLGDTNGDGYDDLIIGSIPYTEKGERTQISYVIYGNSFHHQNHTILFLTDLQTRNLGMKVTGGGLVVNGVGDMNGDGLNDIMITKYDEWQGKAAAIMVHFPDSVPVPSSAYPSLRPSLTPSLLTNMPSSIPTTSFTDSPNNPPFDNTSSRSPSFLPSRKPSFQVTRSPTRVPQSSSSVPTTITTVPPTTRRPYISPPSTTSFPSLVPHSRSPTKQPTVTPSRLPSQSPIISSFPSLSPSLAPSFSSSMINQLSICRSEVNRTGSYFGCEEPVNEFHIHLLHEGESVTVTGNGTVNRFIIYPQSNSKIIITNFQLFYDVIDVSAISGLQTMNDLDYSTPPLTIHLPNQTIQFLNCDEWEFTERNFIFFSSESNTRSGSSSSNSHKNSLNFGGVFSTNVVSVLLIFCILFLSTFSCTYFFSARSSSSSFYKEYYRRKPQKINSVLPHITNSKFNSNNNNNKINKKKKKSQRVYNNSNNSDRRRRMVDMSVPEEEYEEEDDEEYERLSSSQENHQGTESELASSKFGDYEPQDHHYHQQYYSSEDDDEMDFEAILGAVDSDLERVSGSDGGDEDHYSIDSVLRSPQSFDDDYYYNDYNGNENFEYELGENGEILLPARSLHSSLPASRADSFGSLPILSAPPLDSNSSSVTSFSATVTDSSNSHFTYFPLYSHSHSPSRSRAASHSSHYSYAATTSIPSAAYMRSRTSTFFGEEYNSYMEDDHDNEQEEEEDKEVAEQQFFFSDLV
jgi:hypothetical protein